MCGIVGYFGGAGNNLTRVLTGMAAIIYRAPDSTGLALFGDDREPIRTRKAVGPVAGLLELLHRRCVYPNTDASLQELWLQDDGRTGALRVQRRLLLLEELPLDFYEGIERGELTYPNFDELVELAVETPRRLSLGWPGRPEVSPLWSILTQRDLVIFIHTLLVEHDLSPVVIETIIRQALLETLAAKQNADDITIAPDDLLKSFERVFAEALAGRQLSTPERFDHGWLPDPAAERFLWPCLMENPVGVPSDYDRDGVRCVFRLLDGALLARMPFRPAASATVQDILEALWPGGGRSHPMDWRVLYGAEKGANVFGWAAAAALTYLQREELLPELIRDLPKDELLHAEAIVPGQTDPLSLRFFTPPIIAHGRWALQSSVTVANAHPFTDSRGQRAVVLNGQFDGKVEAQAREYLEKVWKVQFRSENSSEYLPLLWEAYFEQLSGEKLRYEAVRVQTENELTHYSIGSQAIDYQVYHQVKDKPAEALEEKAFIAAVQQLIRNGGQVAATGMSLLAPRKLYVAAHNRPVFIVRRLENDDFMVVSDINAAMGLFPQELIQEKTQQLSELQQKRRRRLLELEENQAGDKQVRELKNRYDKRADDLLAVFRVEVYPLEGERIFARIENGCRQGQLRRWVRISDFDGNPLPEVEPVHTDLRPPQIRRDLYQSFYETHLQEIPERFRHILRIYTRGGNALPRFEIKRKLLTRRFGRRLGSLRRIVLAGMGSSHHAGLMGKALFQHLLPEVETTTLMPVEVEDIEQAFNSDSDLVVLLSWSATTADMVRLAEDLKERNVMMIAITEKRFADLSLVAQRSVGVIPVLSGEEVTVSGLKSTMCLLFCLDLLGVWLAAERGGRRQAMEVLAQIRQLPEHADRLLSDEALQNLCRDLGKESARSYASVIIDGSTSLATGREAALKLEENSWTAIGKVVDFRDVMLPFLHKEMSHNLVVVNATRLARRKEALGVMRRLHRAGIAFAAVTYASRELNEIQQYCRNWCACLPKVSDSLQFFVDTLFYYQLAFHYGIGHGRSIGEFPRNRTKSVTATIGRPTKRITSAHELLQLNERAKRFPAEPAPLPAPADEPSAWQRQACRDWEKHYYRAMHQLATVFRRRRPLALLLEEDANGTAATAEVFAELTGESGEVVMVPLDRDAEKAACSAGQLWRRLLDCPFKVASPRESLGHFPKHALFVLLACKKIPPRLLARVIKQLPPRTLWLGHATTEQHAATFRQLLGYFPLRKGPATTSSERLYASLNFLFCESWAAVQPDKARTLECHLRRGGEVMVQLLNDMPLRERVHEAMAANRNYKTASIISARRGLGLHWVDRFDLSGAMAMNWHHLGESAHGSLVTVDPRVAAKFVRLDERRRMVALYGEKRTERWERRYLGEQDVDGFLSLPPADLSRSFPSPFYAQGAWYLPELRDDYDTDNDNLIIIDATSERQLPRALNEMATFGCRYPRMVVISQQAFLQHEGHKAFFKYPISNLILLPPMGEAASMLPISECLLPLAMALLGTAMAALGQRNNASARKSRQGSQPAATTRARDRAPW